MANPWLYLQHHLHQNPLNSPHAWATSSVHQLLKFLLRCWKSRNHDIYRATKIESHLIELEAAHKAIKIRFQETTSMYAHNLLLANHRPIEDHFTSIRQSKSRTQTPISLTTQSSHHLLMQKMYPKKAIRSSQTPSPKSKY